FLEAFLQPQQRKTETLDVFVTQPATLHASHRLVLEDLPYDFDQREHQLRETCLDVFRVRLDSLRQRGRKLAQIGRDQFELLGGGAALIHVAKDHGGQGPLVRKCSPACAAVALSSALVNPAASSRRTRNATVARPCVVASGSTRVRTTYPASAASIAAATVLPPAKRCSRAARRAASASRYARPLPAAPSRTSRAGLSAPGSRMRTVYSAVPSSASSCVVQSTARAAARTCTASSSASH